MIIIILIDIQLVVQAAGTDCSRNYDCSIRWNIYALDARDILREHNFLITYSSTRTYLLQVVLLIDGNGTLSIDLQEFMMQMAHLCHLETITFTGTWDDVK